ncbi:hypothetical protein GF323_01985 [Candidatus Woesearchaeota archaeon]|nr:hypothetical protein [Candidatus Woesearchaeota archaeon]
MGVKYIFLSLALVLMLSGGFLIGFGLSSFYIRQVSMPSDYREISLNYSQKTVNNPRPSDIIPGGIKKLNSPKNRIEEKDIRIYNKAVIINVDNAVLARFADTKSMEPVLNKDTNAIEIIPEKGDDIHVGDIISYESAFSDGIIIHRVIEKGIDENGVYFKTKGDNLDYTDPEKIRFSHVKRIVVGILY